MKDGTLATMIASLPDKAALSGIRASLPHEGLEGNLEGAAKVFAQVWQCEGHDGIKAESKEIFSQRARREGGSLIPLWRFQAAAAAPVQSG